MQDALSQETSYMSNLTRSMSLVLDEFYESFEPVGVSAATGFGMDELWSAIQKACGEFETEYRTWYRQQKVCEHVVCRIKCSRTITGGTQAA
jgi:GPN-loop GTPase